jgi:tubulin-like protein CetZ
MTIGVLGLGQAGSSVADIFASKDYPTGIINYSISDLNSCQNVQSKLQLLGSEGVGKQRELATQLMQNNWENVINFTKEQFNHSSIKVIFVVFSTGGGTGSGVAPLIIDLLQNELEDKIIVAVPILPSDNESTVSHINSLSCIQELSDVNVCILPLDNNLPINLNNKQILYKEVNNQFLNTIETLLNLTERSSQYSNLDKADLIKLFSTYGFCSISSTNISNLDSNIKLTTSSILESINKSFQNSIFMHLTYSKLIRLGVIFNGQESLMSLVNPQSISQQFQNSPLDTFEGYYTKENGGDIHVIFTGLSFDRQRLKQIEDKTITDSETLKNVLDESHKITVKSSSVDLIQTRKPKKNLSSILAKYKK